MATTGSNFEIKPGIGHDFKARLARGELVVGCNIRHSRTAEIGAILRDCGYAWLMLDNEHSPMSPTLAYDMALGAIRAGVVPMARVRRNDPAEIASWLTNGALGVIVPHVDSAAEAQSAAHAAKYPPMGGLSVPGSIPQFGYGIPLAHAAAAFNRESLTVLMVESEQAIEDVEAIAATPNVDVLFIGGSDLVFDMGLPGGYGDAKFTAAVERVVAAARRHGKFVGLGGVSDDAHWETCVGLGVQMILAENDLTMLIKRARERSGFFDRLAATRIARPE